MGQGHKLFCFHCNSERVKKECKRSRITPPQFCGICNKGVCDHDHWESHVCPVEDWGGVDFTKFEAERIKKPLENDIVILKNQYLAKHHEGNKYWIELTNKAIEKYLNTTSRQ